MEHHYEGARWSGVLAPKIEPKQPKVVQGWVRDGIVPLTQWGPGVLPQRILQYFFFKVQLSAAMSTNRLCSVSVECGMVKRECCITE